jgi:hypothetical protein
MGMLGGVADTWGAIGGWRAPVQIRIVGSQLYIEQTSWGKGTSVLTLARDQIVRVLVERASRVGSDGRPQDVFRVALALRSGDVLPVAMEYESREGAVRRRRRWIEQLVFGTTAAPTAPAAAPARWLS